MTVTLFKNCGLHLLLNNLTDSNRLRNTGRNVQCSGEVEKAPCDHLVGHYCLGLVLLDQAR